MTKLKLSYKGKVVATIAVIVSFIILAWPFGGSKDDAPYNNTLAIAKTIVSIIYLVWQKKWHDHYEKLNLYGYNFGRSKEMEVFRLQQIAENKKQYVFACTICTIAAIGFLVSPFISPGSSPLNLFVGVVATVTYLFVIIYVLGTNITKLLFFTISHIHDFYKSFDFAEFVLNLPIVSDLFEQPATKEQPMTKEKPTKKINL